MTIDKAAHKERVEKAQNNVAKKNRAMYEVVTRQAVQLTAVTNDENWDFFLSILQAAIKQAEAAAQGYLDALLSPLTMDPVVMAKEKLRYHICKERIDTLKYIIKVPAAIIKSGELAEGLLAAMPDLKEEKEED